MRVIMTAGEIPTGSVVTKVTGKKAYRLHEVVNVYSKHPDTCSAQKLSHDGVRFLMDMEGLYIEAIPATLELSWEVDSDDLMHHLQREADDRDSR